MMDGAMTVGETVMLSCSGDSIHATVRYCSPGEPGTYRIGLEFGPGYHWSPLVDWPDHRLDVAADQEGSLAVP